MAKAQHLSGRVLPTEAFTFKERLFWAGVFFYGLGSAGSLVASGFPGWNFLVALDIVNLSVFALAVLTRGRPWWSKGLAASVVLSTAGICFTLTLVYQLGQGPRDPDLVVYNNLFLLALLFGPAGFFGGRVTGVVFGALLLTLLAGTSVLWPGSKMAHSAWYEVPAVLGVTAVLYSYRSSLDQVLLDLQVAVRENTLLRERERLAALGELTAGISHEIKNPLNLVVNFAESSSLLLDELQRAPSDQRAALVEDLRQNLEEIRHQGLRGVTIVQTMLLHARSQSSTDPVDLVPLAEECLNLAWLSHRDRYPSGTIRRRFVGPGRSVWVQGRRADLVRAFVNLCNNALWSVSARSARAGSGYTPEVEVEVSEQGDEALVVFRDNGVGFDSRTHDQLFVPFFTTKPPGEGTGLGLSLTREVIEDQHGGRIDAEGTPGQGARFTVVLPLGGGT